MLPFETSARDLRRRLDAGEAIRLIDVREPFEHAIAHIANAELIPMGYASARLTHLENEAEESTLVVICHHGIRSLQVVHWLRQHGVENCQSLAGGIDAWSTDIDDTVPRY